MLEWVEGMTLLYMALEVLEPSKDCCSISRGEMEKADLWSFSFKRQQVKKGAVPVGVSYFSKGWPIASNAVCSFCLLLATIFWF